MDMTSNITIETATETYVAPTSTKANASIVQALRILVRAFEDAMKTRVMQQNRLAQIALAAQGHDTTKRLDQDDEADAKLAAVAVTEIMADYDAITEYIAGTSPKAAERVKSGELTKRDLEKALDNAEQPHGLIQNKAALMVCAMLDNAKRAEVKASNAIQANLDGIPIWDEFLSQVPGCGPRIAGNLIASIDISKARYASSLWKLCGYDVAQDGRGRSRRKEHLVDKVTIDSDGNEVKHKGIGFNPQLKTVLFYLGDQFNRKPDSHYGQLLRNEKHRLENHAKYGLAAEEAYANAPKDDKPEYRPSKGHRQNMARRKAIKHFLVDLYKAWRALEGLEVHEPYHAAKLGMRDVH